MDSIRVVWGDSDWYTDVGRVEMFGSDLVVHVSASVDQATAERICHAVAVSHFDENAEPIGYLTVHVRSTYELANCPIS